MNPLQFILNLLWIMLGGGMMAVAWFFGAVIAAITIVGLPWAKASFNIAVYTFLPFGHTAISRETAGITDIGTGPLGTIGNVVWFVLMGWWLALLHIVFAIAFFVTIFGIPFGWAHVKLARIALWPIGQMVVPLQHPRLRPLPR